MRSDTAFSLISFRFCLALSLLSLLSCEAEITYRTQQVVIDLNDCIERLDLEQEGSCGQFVGASREGCFVISNHLGDTHRLPIQIGSAGLEPLNGDEELFGDLRFNLDEGGQLSIFLYSSPHANQPFRCAALEVTSRCEEQEGCVIAAIDQNVIVKEEFNSIKFTNAECLWSAPQQELTEILCDELDNDCDGKIDEFTFTDLEDLSELEQEANNLESRSREQLLKCTSGLGLCQIESSRQCLDGPGKPPRCVPTEIEASTEICDGADNDCDGEVDEGFNINTSCKLYEGSECEVEGVITCLEQSEQTTGTQTFCDIGDVNPLEAAVEFEGNGNECNGKDDDCDGEVDEHFVPQVVNCGEGSCSETAFTSCTEGRLSDICRAGTANGQDDNCNGIDDDCDGRADEAYQTETITCGLGVCIGNGPLLCERGNIRDLCVIRSALGLDNECDGIDQNCNGSVDENYEPEVVLCGQGACERQDVIDCVNAQLIDRCVPGVPSPDNNCNGIDDDCDGRIDESYQSHPTQCGVGFCQATGLSYCEQGIEKDSCLAGNPSNLPDLCDGVDQDCDGFVDENHVIEVTTCGFGSCASTGQLRCVGLLDDTCTPGLVQTSNNDSVCDGIDSDCDGKVDEGFVGQVVACGVGSCADTGLTTCINGNGSGNTCVVGTPATTDSSCDGIDQDCDGLVDENFTGEPSTCGIGICQRSGQSICVDGFESDGCQPGQPIGNDSSCDGVDQDCDGRSDEGYQTQGISCGIGVCTRNGQKVCRQGMVSNECVPGQATNNDSNCDGQDNDCDGKIDESYVSQATSCGQGICRGNGVLVCTPNGLIDTCSEQTPIDQDVRCDGLDTDCDGRIDESFVSQQISCGIGICQREGQTRCMNGDVIQDCQPGMPEATDSNCDLLDNNCNGSTDEDFVIVENVVNCLANECPAVGNQICTTNGLDDTCTPIDMNAVDDSCDGVDQDCDENIDEAYIPPSTGVMVSCGLGVCFNDMGSLACEEGRVVATCSPFSPNGPDDNCDGIDDDCDGSADEAFSQSSFCGLGQCYRESSYLCIDGQVVDQCVAGTPATHDQCGNNSDDDCNGSVTNYPINQACTITLQACTSSGIYQCNSELNGVTCVGEPPQIVAETCDGVDNDCDGVIDNNINFEDPTCSANNVNGLCQAGTLVCVNGQTLCQAGEPVNEIPCNQIDEDCDGKIDEESINGQTYQFESSCGGGGCKWRCPVFGESFVCSKRDGTTCP